MEAAVARAGWGDADRPYLVLGVGAEGAKGAAAVLLDGLVLDVGQPHQRLEDAVAHHLHLAATAHDPA